jgi:hypothetical protein
MGCQFTQFDLCRLGENLDSGDRITEIQHEIFDQEFKDAVEKLVSHLRMHAQNYSEPNLVLYGIVLGILLMQQNAEEYEAAEHL